MKYLALLLFNVLLTSAISAQQEIIPTGNSISNSAGSLSFTVGQISYRSSSSSELSVNEGVQQASELYISSTYTNNSNDLEINAFPNPTQKRIILSVNRKHLDQQLSYLLISSNGTLLEEDRIDGLNTELLIDYPEGAFIIQILDDSGDKLKSFKILKIQ